MLYKGVSLFIFHCLESEHNSNCSILGTEKIKANSGQYFDNTISIIEGQYSS